MRFEPETYDCIQLMTGTLLRLYRLDNRVFNFRTSI